MELIITRDYEGMDIEELEFEKQDLYNAFQNEVYLLMACTDAIEMDVHNKNMKKLKDEIAYINSLIRKLVCA